MARKASPPTPAILSSPGRKPGNCSTSGCPAAATPTTPTWSPPATATRTASSAATRCCPHRGRPAHPHPGPRRRPAVRHKRRPRPRRPAARLAAAAARYHDALTTAAASLLTDQQLTAFDATAEQISPGLTAQPAYPTPRGHLALLAADGHDPTAELPAAAARRPLTDAHDPAAVLDSRLDPTHHRTTGRSPLPWLPGIPRQLRENTQWKDYLTGRAEQISTLAAEIREQAAGWPPGTAPPWAAALLDADPTLVGDLAAWRAALAVDPTDTSPVRPAPATAAEARAHQQLTDRAAAVLGRPGQARPPHAGPARHQHRPPAHHRPVLAAARRPAHRRRPRRTRRRRPCHCGRRRPGTTRRAARRRPLVAARPPPIPRRAARQPHPHRHHPVPSLDPATHHPVHRHHSRPGYQRPGLARLGRRRHQRAAQHGWTLDQILGTAHDLLATGHPASEPLRPDETAAAIVWRISALTDPSPRCRGNTHRRPSRATGTRRRPDHTSTHATARDAADALPDLDADWEASLQPPDDTLEEPPSTPTSPTPPATSSGRPAAAKSAQ